MITLPDGRCAYGQCIYDDPNYGALTRIFAELTKEPLIIAEVPTDKLLFPPVYIGFGSVFKNGRWRILGSMPVPQFSFPKFRSSLGLKPGQYEDWKIYDGVDLRPIGKLPPECRSLEFLCVWSPQAIEQRIITGKARQDEIV